MVLRPTKLRRTFTYIYNAYLLLEMFGPQKRRQTSADNLRLILRVVGDKTRRTFTGNAYFGTFGPQKSRPISADSACLMELWAAKTSPSFH